MSVHIFDRALLPTAEKALGFITDVLQSSTEYSIIASEMDGTMVLWNQGASKNYGYEAEEVVGKLNASQLYAFGGVDIDKPARIRDTALQDGRWEGLIERRRKNGETFVARVVVTPRFDCSGTVIGFLTISKDISEENRLLDKLEKANRELREQVTKRQCADEALLAAHNEVLSNARSVEQAALHLKQLADMSEILQACATTGEAREIIQRSLQKFFPQDAAVLYLKGVYGSLLEIFVSSEAGVIHFKETLEPHECWALRRSRAHTSGDDGTSIRCEHWHSSTPDYSICVPMMGHGQLLGVFQLASISCEGAGNQNCHADKLKFAQAFADICALALSNVRLVETLRDRSFRDPLTQLYNRRFLEESLNREISRARRCGTPIGVIMIDLDNFKQFNDSFGHLKGDQLLSSLGSYLQGQVRLDDISSRYGGDEFVLILPGASREIVQGKAERLRRGFRYMPIQRELALEDAAKTLSISCGVAVFPADSDSSSGIVLAADRALYEAKKGGKDRVVLAGPHVSAKDKILSLPV